MTDPQVEASAEGEKTTMSKQEREMEQSMVKVISRMPESVQDRFKVLHVLSDERSKLNDLFEKEVAELAQKFEQRKKPILLQRDAILKGENTDFSAFTGEFDATATKLETVVAGIVKSQSEKEADEKEAAEHKPKDVATSPTRPACPTSGSARSRTTPCCSR